MTQTVEQCQRPWWMRPPVWFIGIAALVALIIGIAVEQGGKRAPTPYGVFLDQLEAGKVASVTFRGTEIDGRFKRSGESTPASNAAQGDSFHSQVPDFGDPGLIAQLRQQHVAIDVSSQSAWTVLFAHLPLPMLFIIGAMLIAGLVRLVRGGTGATTSPTSMHPMHGLMGLLSGLFAKQRQEGRPSQQDRNESETR